MYHTTIDGPVRATYQAEINLFRPTRFKRVEFSKFFNTYLVKGYYDHHVLTTAIEIYHVFEHNYDRVVMLNPELEIVLLQSSYVIAGPNDVTAQIVQNKYGEVIIELW